MATQMENDKLQNDIGILKTLNEKLDEKNEIMVDTEAILAEDNARLRNAPAEQNQITNQEQLVSLTKRVDHIKVELFQKDQEVKELRVRFDLQEKSFGEERNLLEDEIDSLKDQNAMLKG